MKNFYQGNLNEDFNKSLDNSGQGWLIGNFCKFSNDDVRRSPFLEVKYWDFEEKPNKEHSAKQQRRATEFTLVIDGWIEGWVERESNIIKLCKDDFIVINPLTKNNLVKKKSKEAKVLTIKVPSDSKDKALVG